MSATISIDHAASGFLRHRFVRTMAASWIVLIIVGLLALIAWAAAAQNVANTAQFIGMGIAIPFVLAAFLAPIILATAVGGALVDLVHRRLVALIALPALWAVVIAAPLVMFQVLAEFGGWRPPSETRGVQAWALFALAAVSALVAWEGAGWAWWQLTVSREGFLATRGFRPPPWRLLSTFRRQIGLPPFISNFGRGRVGLTLVYFIEAALNAGIVCLLALPFLAFGSDELSDREGIVIAAAVLAGLLLLNLLRVGRIIDWFADRRATQIYQNVRDWDARPPIVFLRAFDQDDAKLPALTRDPFVKFPSGVGSPRTPDEILLEHASPYGPVIAIGDPRDPTPPLGAARVFAPGDGLAWQDIVKALVGASKAVVMCPKDTEGVKWEIDLIASAGGRVRTIYLANPEVPAAENDKLFARLAPDGKAPTMPEGQAPIAAFVDPKRGWRVLTTSKPPCVQTYVIALNMALIAMFGQANVSRMSGPRKGRASAPNADAAQRAA